MQDLNVSIVLYHTDKSILIKAIESVLKSNLVKHLFLIDNSRGDKLREIKSLSEKILYIHTRKNLGYGKAHNIALKKSLENNIKYHLAMNPDIYFNEGVLEKLYRFMEENEEVGLVMPKVLYPNGKLQYLCKLLPTPFDLFSRRFLNWGVFKKIVEKRQNVYELRFTGYDKIIEAPFLSGCFMFLRVKILEKIGLFDERFFLYCDDLDLSRRIHSTSKTILYPYCEIYHEWGRGSYKNFKLLIYHIVDAIRYFNKWGWFFDKERKETNKKILKNNLFF
ncbi:MAG: glycosyltransferase [Spirochaetia bacterium]|nr:glycosyltransferase [Spirochaetota bacterium]MDW8113200.1 glycosyltransferase [Spirochaetia bacterium]